MPQAEEWDWPPRQRTNHPVEARIVRERVVLPKRRDTAQGFNRVLVTILKVIVAIPLGGIVFASVWLIGAILKA